MSENILFKVKSNKKNNPEAKTTLDAIHTQKVQSLIEDKNAICTIQSDIDELKNKMNTSTSDTDIWRYEQHIERLEKKKRALENGDELNEYLLRTGDILFNYYDIQEQIQQGSAQFQTVKGKKGSILAILEEVAQDEGISPNTTQTPTIPAKNALQRNDLLNQYLQIEEPDMVQIDEIEMDDPWTNCPLCGAEMIMCMNEANLTCKACGYQEFILIDSDKPSYKDPPREVSYYAYKKINHFNEWLAQFQAKESTEIPQEIYDAILLRLKKERITNMATIKPAKMREILRSMKCAKYYEHIPHIINRLNGINAPFMSRENEEKLRHMFREIQPSFKKHCPKGRRNFLSYSYVLYKFCELLEMDEFLSCFSLLKNREHLIFQDKTWQKICADMSWQYIRTA